MKQEIASFYMKTRDLRFIGTNRTLDGHNVTRLTDHRLFEALKSKIKKIAFHVSRNAVAIWRWIDGTKLLIKDKQDSNCVND